MKVTLQKRVPLGRHRGRVAVSEPDMTFGARHSFLFGHKTKA